MIMVLATCPGAPTLHCDKRTKETFFLSLRFGVLPVTEVSVILTRKLLSVPLVNITYKEFILLISRA